MLGEGFVSGETQREWQNIDSDGMVKERGNDDF